MAKIEKFICDECKAEKKDVNHWHQMVVSEGVLHLYPWTADLSGEENEIIHLCGQECVLSKVDEFMSKGAKKR
jgi:hypothetical protein